MKRQQSGFTLIALVIVIVILGALAVVAIPRFIDLSDQANEAALEGVAGSMASGMAINFAGCSAVGHDSDEPQCEAITDCNEVGNTLQGGEIPDGYTVEGNEIGTDNGDTAECTVTQTETENDATFTGIVAGQ